MKKNTVIFICLLLVCTVLVFCIPSMFKKGNRVEVRIQDEVYETYDLHTDQVVRIDIDEQEYNIFEIKDGSVNMIEATCPNQICVHDAPITIDTPGVIVCMPHQLIVEIKE